MKKLYPVLSKVNRMLQKLEKAVGCISLAVLFVVMILNAALRYLFSSGLNWSDELNGFLFVWFSFFSAAYAMSGKAHLSVTFLVDMMPETVQYLLQVLMNGIMTVMFVIYMPSLHKLLNTLPISNVMRVPMSAVYLILPLSFLMMCYHMIFNIISDTRQFLNERRKGIST